VSGSCFYRNSSGAITTWTSLFGVRYASLDTTIDGKCVENRTYCLPAGWSLAPNDQASLLTIYLSGWVTYVVVVGDSTSYYAGEYNVMADYSVLHSNPGYCPGGVTGYSVLSCDAIILISQPFPVPEFATGHQSIGAPAVSNNFITFEGMDYAVGDNSPYADTTVGCQTYSVYLNDSTWSIAASAPASKVVLQSSITLNPYGNWGALCLILADGLAYGQNTAQCALTNAMSTFTYQGGVIYTVKNCSLPAKILLSRTSAAGTPNSWTTQATITNTFVNGTKIFASLDNSLTTNSLNVVPCQANFMAVPTGYTPATTDVLHGFLVNPGWACFESTYCLGSTDTGIAYNHPNLTTGVFNECGTVLSEVVDGVTYYQASPCGRVLLVKD